MNIRKLFSPYNKKNKQTEKLGLNVRESVKDPNAYHKPTAFPIITPDAKGKLKITDLEFKDIKNMSVERLISMLVNSSDTISAAVDIYQEYTVTDYQLIAENDRDKQIIEDFIQRLEESNESFNSILKRFAYGVYVEGAFCGELTYTDDGREAISIDYVSPFSMSVQQREHPVFGIYDVIGQQIGYGRQNFKVLQDKANPSPFFKYTPVKVQGDKALGQSSIAPALFGAYTLYDIIKTSVEYTKGLAFPTFVLYLKENEAEEVEYAERVRRANAATTEIRNVFANRKDVSQAVVISEELDSTQLGEMSRNRLDVVDMIVEIAERGQQRALKTPPALLPSKQIGGGLNSDVNRVQWHAFMKRLMSGKHAIEKPFTDWFRTILRSEGSNGECKLHLVGEDEELRRIMAETLEIEVNTYDKLMERQVFFPEEMRKHLINTSPLLEGLDLEMPEEPDDDPQPEPAPSDQESIGWTQIKYI